MTETSFEQSEANKVRFEAVFERAFSLLGHPDAVAANLTAFILDKDPQTDVALLSNSFFLQHATTVSIANSEIEVDGNHAGLFDSELTIDFMLIPCRVVGSLSYGCVGRRLHGSMASCAQDASVLVHNIAMGRYVRNEATGELLIVVHSYRDEHEEDTVSVVHTRFEGTTRQSSLRAMFNPKEFENVEVGPIHAVRRAADGNFTRFCPVCRASPHSKCSCILPYVLPSSPTDLATVALNSRHTIGDWMGRSTNFVHCPSYMKYGTATVMTRCSTRAPLATIPFALHQGILQSRLAMANPARSVMPSMYEAVMARPANFDFANVDLNVDSAAMFGDGPPLDSKKEGIDRGLLEDADVNHLPSFVLDDDALGDCDAAIDCCGEDGKSEPVVVPLPTPSMSVDRDILNVFNVVPDSGAALHVSSPITDAEEWRPTPLVEQTLSSHAVQGEAVGELEDPAGLMMTALLSQHPELALSNGGSASSATVGGHDLSTPSVSSGENDKLRNKPNDKRRKRPPRRESPEKEVESADAAGRHAARVEKNRAAARVSNARRKERNLTLRHDLSFFRDRLKELREREKHLRDENLKLKSASSA